MSSFDESTAQTLFELSSRTDRPLEVALWRDADGVLHGLAENAGTLYGGTPTTLSLEEYIHSPLACSCCFSRASLVSGPGVMAVVRDYQKIRHVQAQLSEPFEVTLPSLRSMVMELFLLNQLVKFSPLKPDASEVYAALGPWLERKVDENRDTLNAEIVELHSREALDGLNVRIPLPEVEAIVKSARQELLSFLLSTPRCLVLASDDEDPFGLSPSASWIYSRLYPSHSGLRVLPVALRSLPVVQAYNACILPSAPPPSQLETAARLLGDGGVYDTLEKALAGAMLL